jgi:hypothetical protein
MNNREWNKILPGKCIRNYVFSALPAHLQGEECQASLTETDHINI